MNLVTYITQDFREDPSSGVKPPRLLTVRGLATLLFRISQITGEKLPLGGAILKQLNHLLTGADIAWQAQIGPNVNFFHPTGVVVGEGVVLGANCQIQEGVTLGASGGTVEGNPTIGDSVHLGSGAKVLGPVRIGSRSVVGANAVVRIDVPEDSLAVGVPAVIKARSSQRSESPAADAQCD